MSAENDGAITLDLDAGAQSFQAILAPGRSRSLLQRLAQERRLRLRGVSARSPTSANVSQTKFTTPSRRASQESGFNFRPYVIACPTAMNASRARSTLRFPWRGAVMWRRVA